MWSCRVFTVDRVTKPRFILSLFLSFFLLRLVSKRGTSELRVRGVTEDEAIANEHFEIRG